MFLGNLDVRGIGCRLFDDGIRDVEQDLVPTTAVPQAGASDPRDRVTGEAGGAYRGMILSLPISDRGAAFSHSVDKYLGTLTIQTPRAAFSQSSSR